MADVTPLRQQVVPAYMDCDFAVRIRRDGMPEIIGRRTGVAYYEVRKAPGGGPEAGLIAEEICDHLNGRETAARELERLRAENAQMKDMLGALWLYVGWRYCTKQLPTEQKELWAAAVEGWSAKLNEGSDEPGVVADRWWLCPTCGISIRAQENDGPHENCSFDEERKSPLTEVARG